MGFTIIYVYRLKGIPEFANVVKIGKVTTLRNIKDCNINELKELLIKMAVENNLNERSSIIDFYCEEAIKKRIKDQAFTVGIFRKFVDIVFAFVAVGTDANGKYYTIDDNDIRETLINKCYGNIVPCHKDYERFEISGREWIGLTSEALEEGKDYNYIINELREITKDNNYYVVHDTGKDIPEGTKNIWEPKPLQRECIDDMLTYFKDTGVKYGIDCRFLVYAACRFGKTYTVLRAIKEWNEDPEVDEENKMKVVLITSYVASAIAEWKDTFTNHVDFGNQYVLVELEGKAKYKDNETKIKNAIAEGKYVIILTTGQNLTGSIKLSDAPETEDEED